MTHSKIDIAPVLEETKFVVFSHANCNDGIGAAWVAAHYLQEAGGKYQVYFLGHGEITWPEGLEGKEIYFLDWCPSLNDTKLLIETNMVKVIDHHKTNYAELEGFTHPYLETTFDNGHSGAVLTWMYFYGDKDVPELLSYIEDRDIWTKKLPDVDLVSSALFSNPANDLDVFNLYMNMDIESIISEGRAIEKFVAKKRNIMLHSMLRYGYVGDDKVVLANNMESDLLHEALHAMPDAKYAVGYLEYPEGIRYALRSEGEVDISIIAKQHGGGGHMHAAGCMSSLDSRIFTECNANHENRFIRSALFKLAIEHNMDFTSDDIVRVTSDSVSADMVELFNTAYAEDIECIESLVLVDLSDMLIIKDMDAITVMESNLWTSGFKGGDCNIKYYLKRSKVNARPKTDTVMFDKLLDLGDDENLFTSYEGNTLVLKSLTIDDAYPATFMGAGSDATMIAMIDANDTKTIEALTSGINNSSLWEIGVEKCSNGVTFQYFVYRSNPSNS